MTNVERLVEAVRTFLAEADVVGRAEAPMAEALAALDAGQCEAWGIGGDPAWPRSYKCNMPKHEGNRHMDPYLGSWDKR
jgi:hypothetical protein